MKTISLAGGNICGWLAAYAHWFLGLEIEIRDTDGITQFKTVAGSADVHILILYGNSQSAVQVCDTTYIISNSYDLISQKDKLEYSIDQGRVSWNAILQTSFGTAAKSLLAAGDVFGMFMGSVARIFEFTSFADPGLLDLLPCEYGELTASQQIVTLLSSWISHGDRSFGRGYIAYAVEALPELQVTKPGAEIAVEKDFQDALQDYKTALLGLRHMCGCARCEMLRHRGIQHQYPNSETICIYYLAKSIIILVWALSLTSFPTEMHPTRSGMRDIYQKCSSSLYLRGIRFDKNPSIYEFLGYLNLGTLQHSVSRIFTGTCQSDEDFSLSNHPAVCHRGVCFFINTLQMTQFHRSSEVLMFMLPGAIESRSGALYQHVEDFSDYQFRHAATKYQQLTNVNDIKDTADRSLKMNLVVKERIGAVQVSLEFSNAGGILSCAGPFELLRRILRHSGLVSCSKNGCQVLGPPFPSIFTVDGEVYSDQPEDVDNGREIVIRQLEGNLASKYWTLLMDSYKFQEIYQNGPRVGFVFRLGECLSCCIKTARRWDTNVTYIV